jgi:formamidopyrimidine-DNA glycosylase
MPELPEVHTTATGLSRIIPGLKIIDVWTDYNSPYFKGSDTIKDPKFFSYFKKEVCGSTITDVTRRAKNVLIHLNNKKIILIHMKMTGHVMVGNYVFNKKHKNSGVHKSAWQPALDERSYLHDPFNRFIHFVITLSNGKSTEKHLVLSDTRKFAKVTLINNDAISNDATAQLNSSIHLKDLGPEPLDKSFTFSVFKSKLSKKSVGKIKTVLMDQAIISGIGNIYSDEALWRAGIHPEEKVFDISDKLLKKLYTETIKVLRKGIDFGGDSMSDYRNVDGERGKFQEQHQVYRKKDQPCSMMIGAGKNTTRCTGTIKRIVVGGRSTHFCPVHQTLSV